MRETYVAGPVIVKNKKLLVILDYEDGFYKFPGGTVREGEDFISCVKREAKEEIGVEVNVGELIKDIVIKKSGKKVHLLHYKAKLKEKPKKTNEIKEYKWISYDDYQKFSLAPNVKEILELLHEKGEL